VLDPSRESFLVFRSKAYVEQNLYAKALEDAEKVLMIAIIYAVMILISQMYRSLNSTLRRILGTK
jgi:isocitrate dehydrogenase